MINKHIQITNFVVGFVENKDGERLWTLEERRNWLDKKRSFKVGDVLGSKAQ